MQLTFLQARKTALTKYIYSLTKLYSEFSESILLFCPFETVGENTICINRYCEQRGVKRHPAIKQSTAIGKPQNAAVVTLNMMPEQRTEEVTLPCVCRQVDMHHTQDTECETKVLTAVKMKNKILFYVACVD